MRIWHESLIPKLCQKHLCAMWFEGLGAYKIITENKKGYRNHPAVKEFEGHLDELWLRLYEVREEMVNRGYKPKELLKLRHKPINDKCCTGKILPWQTLEEQIAILKQKGCECKI